MEQRWIKWAAPVVLVLLAGCAIQQIAPAEPAFTQQRYKPSQVDVYFSASDVPGPFARLDDVMGEWENGDNSADDVLHLLRMRAGNMGANAIIVDRAALSYRPHMHVVVNGVEAIDAVHAQAIHIGQPADQPR